MLGKVVLQQCSDHCKVEACSSLVNAYKALGRYDDARMLVLSCTSFIHGDHDHMLYHMILADLAYEGGGADEALFHATEVRGRLHVIVTTLPLRFSHKKVCAPHDLKAPPVSDSYDLFPGD